ncbi:hypothetical protein [Sabulibacter ruber]|uniref:hypothetical protein n=1 Tax=Sabulibacter ruber TaxID=2811901 RepID=UPI001A95C6E7|nr:hypothetical protein [Sabulibacter ruber]
MGQLGFIFFAMVGFWLVREEWGQQLAEVLPSVTELSTALLANQAEMWQTLLLQVLSLGWLL